MSCVEYKDDAYIIPRSSSVIVKRVYARPGKGRAAYYLGTAGPSGSTADGNKGSGSGAGSGAVVDGNVTKSVTSSGPRPEALG